MVPELRMAYRNAASVFVLNVSGEERMQYQLQSDTAVILETAARQRLVRA